MEAKKQIRKEFLAKRNALGEETVRELSGAICEKLKEYLCMQAGLQENGVYGYYPHGREVSLLELYSWLLAQHIPLAFPRVNGEMMEFYRVTSMEEFQEGAFHIMEPVLKCRRADLKKAYCLVPGSVFDEAGNRYGYGKGYYDRYFRKNKQLKRIGVSYEMQLQPEIPTEANDIKMQILVTESKIREI